MLLPLSISVLLSACGSGGKSSAITITELTNTAPSHNGDLVIPISENSNQQMINRP